jgi:hypothetical protein
MGIYFLGHDNIIVPALLISLGFNVGRNSGTFSSTIPQGVFSLRAIDQEAGGETLSKRQQEVFVDNVNQRPLRTNLQLHA